MKLQPYFHSGSEGGDQEKLDRRRLEEAHMKFCVLDVFVRYPQVFSTWKIFLNLQQCLDDVTPTYYNAFTSKYAGLSVNINR